MSAPLDILLFHLCPPQPHSELSPFRRCPASSYFSSCHSFLTPLSFPSFSSHYRPFDSFRTLTGEHNCCHGNQVVCGEGHCICNACLGVLLLIWRVFLYVSVCAALRARWNIKAEESAGSDCDGNGDIRATRGHLLYTQTQKQTCMYSDTSSGTKRNSRS